MPLTRGYRVRAPMSGSRMRPCLAALVLVATPSLADGPMSPDEFDIWSTGKTLAYSVDGQIYGAEAYFPDRRVRDADTGGPCVEGRWYADGDAVCFVYPVFDGVHCWTYWRDGDAVLAKPVNAPAGDPAQQVTEAEAPLSCPGPEVGV